MEPNQTKPNQTSDGSRRKLLKSLAAGSGAILAGTSLPDKWVSPVVDSVILPAHAQTSSAGEYFGTLETDGSGGFIELCIKIIGSTYVATVIIRGPGFAVLYTHPAASPIGTAVIMSSTCAGATGGPLNVTSVTAALANYNTNGTGTPTGSIPAAPCVIPAQVCPISRSLRKGAIW